MSKMLVTGDLHLTEKEEDGYRWKIFDFLKKQIKQHNHDLDIAVLGDTADRKDRHSGKFLGQIRDEFLELADLTGGQVIVVLGNHDVLDGSWPPLEFLDYVHEQLHFVADYREIMLPGNRKVAVVPHCMDGKGETYQSWWGQAKQSDADFILTHETFNGAVVSNGYQLEGEHPPEVDKWVLAGDVHVGQTIGNVVQVGSPYAVHFGDNFQPRCILVDDDNELHDVYSTGLELPSRFSWKVTSLKELENNLDDSKEGDQAKIKFSIPTNEVSYWSTYKSQIEDWCEGYGVELAGLEVVENTQSQPLEARKEDNRTLSKEDYFYRYCKQESVSEELKQVGQELLSD